MQQSSGANSWPRAILPDHLKAFLWVACLMLFLMLSRCSHPIACLRASKEQRTFPDPLTIDSHQPVVSLKAAQLYSVHPSQDGSQLEECSQLPRSTSYHPVSYLPVSPTSSPQTELYPRPRHALDREFAFKSHQPCRSTTVIEL